jgi:hypothetical protein
VLAFIGFYGSLIFGVSLDGFAVFENVDNIFQLYQYPETYPFFIFIGIVLLLATALFLLETICTIRAAVRAGEGKKYSYPISIPFVKNGKMESKAQPLTPNP